MVSFPARGKANQKIIEGGDGLVGIVLIILGALGFRLIRPADLVLRILGQWILRITLQQFFVGVNSGDVVLFFFVGQADAKLRGGPEFAIRAVLNDLFENLE